MSRYRCVDAQKADGFPVRAACEAAGVSASAYYDWVAVRRDSDRSDRERDEARLVDEIRGIHAVSGEVYGSPRVTRSLRRRGRKVNHKRVERLMRVHGIVGRRPKRRRSLTKPDQAAAPAPDLVGRLFDPGRPDVTWVGDLTYVLTDEGWLYVASVLDLGSRRLIGWSMGESHDAALVCDALDAAVATRGQVRMPDGTVFHTDRGAEYTSTACRTTCARLGLVQSMGRTGSCLDNAVAESFFATLELEVCAGRRFATRAEARTAIFAWFHYYNARRLHSAIGYLTPIEWEHQYDDLTQPLPSEMAA